MCLLKKKKKKKKRVREVGDTFIAISHMKVGDASTSLLG